MIDTLIHDSSDTFHTDLKDENRPDVDREEVSFGPFFVVREMIAHDH
jgi:hypothetical protein